MQSHRQTETLYQLIVIAELIGIAKPLHVTPSCPILAASMFTVRTSGRWLTPTAG